MTTEIYEHGERVSPEILEDQRQCALWGLWTIDAAADAVQRPVDELASDMVQRPDYVQGIYPLDR